jgi:hypothetical protein
MSLMGNVEKIDEGINSVVGTIALAFVCVFLSLSFPFHSIPFHTMATSPKTSLDILAEVAVAMLEAEAEAEMPPPPPLLPAFPRMQLVVRQIKDAWWHTGEQCLKENPDLNETLVCDYHWNKGSHWVYKVARVDGYIVRQTWYNGELVGELVG